MKKIIICLSLFLLCMNLGVSKVEADEYGFPEYHVTFDGSKLQSNDYSREEIKKVLEGMQPGDKAEITWVLSNNSDKDVDWWMSNDTMKTFEEDKKLSDQEMKVLGVIADEITSLGTVPCTACHYCVSHCPKGLDIPHLISLYNEHKFTGGGFIAPMALSALSKDKRPSACIGCRRCEQVCPQQIKISEVFKDFSGK